VSITRSAPALLLAIAAVCALIGVLAAPAGATERHDCRSNTPPVATINQPPTTPPPAPAPAPTPAPAPAPAPAPPAATPPCDCEQNTCTSRRTITIRIVERKGHRLRSAYVIANGKRTNARRVGGRLRVTFTFRGRSYPQDQTESIAIVGRELDGDQVAGTRSYRPCRLKLGHLNGAPFRL
jgi:hypothetical protein